MVCEQLLEKRHRARGLPEELVDPARRAVHEQDPPAADLEPPGLRQGRHPALPLRRGLRGRVVVGDLREVVVARVGVAAVAVRGVGRERLLVVALDRFDARLEQDREDAVGVRTEGAEVAEGEESLRAPAAGVGDRRRERAGVASTRRRRRRAASRPARHSVLVTGVAGAGRERKRPQGLGERRPHPRFGRLDEDRAHVDAARGHHARRRSTGAPRAPRAGASAPRASRAACIPRRRPASAPMRKSDRTFRRGRDRPIERAQSRNRSRPAAAAAPSHASVTVTTGLRPSATRLRRPSRIRAYVPSPRIGSFDGRVPAVDRDAQVQRVLRRLEELAQAAGALGRQEHAVGQDRDGPLLQGVRRDREHLGVHERLAAREVVLPHAEPPGLVEEDPHLGARHHGVGMVRRGAGDEAVRARQVAERPGHLEPERVEGERGNFGVRLQGHDIADLTRGTSRLRRADLRRGRKGKGARRGPLLGVSVPEAQRLRSMSFTNSLRGRAPSARSATSPFLKRMKVGIEVIW